MLAPRSRPTEHAEPSIDQHCDQMVHSMSMVGKNGGRLDEAQQHERGTPATEAKRRRVDIRDTLVDWPTKVCRRNRATDTRGRGATSRSTAIPSATQDAYFGPLRRLLEFHNLASRCETTAQDLFERVR